MGAYDSLKNVSGASKMGYNGTLDSAPEDIWDSGGLYSWPATAVAGTIESSSASDAAAGTGARTVFVEGLLADYSIASETVTLNGTTPVALVGTYLRFNRIRVVTVGSTGSNVGNIIVKQSSTVVGYVAATMGQDRMAIYTIPLGEIGKVAAIKASLARQTTACTADLQLQTRALSESWRVRYDINLVNTGNTESIYYPIVPITILAKTDIRLVCINSSASAIVAGGFEVIHY